MYYVKHITYANDILKMNPSAAKYMNNSIVLTGIRPENYAGAIDNIYLLGFNPTEDPALEGLTEDGLVSEIRMRVLSERSEVMYILSKPQGKYLHTLPEFNPGL